MRRILASLALVWFAALLAANLRTVAPDGGTSSLGPQDPSRLAAFKHGDHVPLPWYEDTVGDEVFRDCRGCHRFGPDQATSSPHGTCEQCHFGSGALDTRFDEGTDEDLSAFASRTREAFRHYTHSMLECRECHGPSEADLQELAAVPPSFPISTGPGECARCHEKTQAREAIAGLRWFRGAAEPDVATALGLSQPFEPPAPADYDDYAAKLDRVFAAERQGINTLLTAGGSFTHGDHLALDLTCTSCHSTIEQAAVDGTGAGQLNAQGCGDCHQGAGGAALQVAQPEQVVRESWSLGTFAHVDHYPTQRTEGVCVEAAYGEIEQQACNRCHRFAPDRPGYDGRDFPFDGVSSEHRYQDCQQCHGVPGWSTGELARQVPLHGSSHPDGDSGWDSTQAKCTECHVFGVPDMAATRPEVEVARWTERTFLFEGQTHPFITTEGGGDANVQEDCRRCHRAVVPSLPSRLIEKRFRHATHLPPAGTELTAAACTTCHPSAARATTSGELAADLRTYDPAACKQCHYGSDVREDVAVDGGAEAARPEPRRVVAFPHAAHVTGGLACTECHDRGDEDMTTRPEALACNQCHDHSRATDGPLAEHLFDDEVRSCASCHDDGGGDAVAVPAIRGTVAATSDPHYAFVQSEFAGFTEPQTHPLGSDCATCHRANVREVRVGGANVARVMPIEAVERDFVFADRLGNFHKDQPAAELRRRFADRETGCMSCHWKDFSDLGEANVLPESRAERQRLGNQFENWPGLQSKG